MKPNETPDLWGLNTPRLFWQFQPNLPADLWETAIAHSLDILRLASRQPPQRDTFLEQTLGEGQFGADHWQLSFPRRLYYTIKPLLPRATIDTIKKFNASRLSENEHQLSWPIEDRYARFLWETARQLLLLSGNSTVSFTPFWPDGKKFAVVLTHDVEGEKGLQFVEQLAELEESLGFRSSFNFVPCGYQTPARLMNSLRERGFEVGVHGLKHDGKLYKSEQNFMMQASSINQYLREFDAKGFRSPLMHRQPAWQQALEIEYDLSFFDTDPYEPLPGGTMCIWPFFIGHFVEMPYTLVQDSTLLDVLNEGNPRLWLEKVDFLALYFGMALLNSHPDYLCKKHNIAVYAEFLHSLQARVDYWHALPGEVARWWRARLNGWSGNEPRIPPARLSLREDHQGISITNE
jgi:hypothetical protein